jgi:dolichol-phosphate mannosyltransferase
MDPSSRSIPAGPAPGSLSARAEPRMRISICIPAYDEEPVLAETLEEALGVIAGIPGAHEIVVVDDGSTDRTWDILTALAERHPLIRPIRHPRNLGNPMAQKTLVEAARGEYIFHIGADGEWRMAELPRMLELLQRGADIVIGVRREKQYTLWRKFVSSAYNMLVAALWGRHFGDLGSIKMARASLWKQLPFATNSAFVNAERVLIAHRNGACIAEIPVEHYARRTGRSRYASPWQALLAFRDLVRFRFSPRSRYRLRADWRESSSS